ncbi:MAG: hypothetical protein ACQET5_03135 [Halobacteriota archaeon]|uniref:hypothetical protein n=1 Tax=Natronomonas sp. TaxID=2184060 RepID=UPI0039747762
MSEKHPHTSTARRFPAIAPIPIATAETSPDIAYVDPNLVVLLFLFGFCLLYVAILVVDTFSSSESTGADQGEYS